MSNSRTKQKQLNRAIGMLPPADNAGTAGTGITVSEEGDGRNHTTVLTCNVTDAFTTGDNAALADGYLAYTFPAGEIIINSAYMSLGVTATTEQAADTPEIGVGTTAGTGAAATLGAVAATAENIITGTAAADAAGTATVLTEITNSGTGLLIATAGAHTVYINIADTWANDTSGDLTCDLSGTLVLNWTFVA